MTLIFGRVRIEFLDGGSNLGGRGLNFWIVARIRLGADQIFGMTLEFGWMWIYFWIVAQIRAGADQVFGVTLIFGRVQIEFLYCGSNSVGCGSNFRIVDQISGWWIEFSW